MSKDRLAVATGGGDRQGEVLNLGIFKNTPASVNKLLKKLAGRGDISVCYEAEPTAAQFEGTLDESWLVSGISLLVLALVLGLSISLDLSVLLWSSESDVRQEGDRIWQRYTATSSSGMRFTLRLPGSLTQARIADQWLKVKKVSKIRMEEMARQPILAALQATVFCKEASI
ncbi:hypothetical protein [Paracoccus sp. (in: a-proteobacteria)]|uniref:hypothetical protein n=1 Tax=Paracoccus sp. TaxID=267 RepID=UPI002AFE6419|nr:hypothetical protein [Paracoccus sp. (in: a-proteobacteria)]